MKFIIPNNSLLTICYLVLVGTHIHCLSTSNVTSKFPASNNPKLKYIPKRTNRHLPTLNQQSSIESKNVKQVSRKNDSPKHPDKDVRRIMSEYSPLLNNRNETNFSNIKLSTFNNKPFNSQRLVNNKNSSIKNNTTQAKQILPFKIINPTPPPSKPLLNQPNKPKPIQTYKTTQNSTTNSNSTKSKQKSKSNKTKSNNSNYHIPTLYSSFESKDDSHKIQNTPQRLLNLLMSDDPGGVGKRLVDPIMTAESYLFTNEDDREGDLYDADDTNINDENNFQLDSDRQNNQDFGRDMAIYDDDDTVDAEDADDDESNIRDKKDTYDEDDYD